MRSGRALDELDPFHLTQFAADRFGLNPNEITRIEAHVGANDLPLLVVTLIAAAKQPDPTT